MTEKRNRYPGIQPYRRTALPPYRREREELVGDRRTAVPPYRRGWGGVEA